MRTVDYVISLVKDEISITPAIAYLVCPLRNIMVVNSNAPVGVIGRIRGPIRHIQFTISGLNTLLFVSPTSINTLSFLLTTILSVAVLGVGQFSFDIAAEDGPLNWGDLDIKNNERGGMAQSGINVPIGPCDELMSDYVFNVSVYQLFCLYSYILFELLLMPL